MLKKMVQPLGVFVSFFFALIGASLIARGLEVARGPSPSGLGNLILYRLDLSDTFSFYLGCVALAASLTFLWSQRSK